MSCLVISLFLINENHMRGGFCHIKNWCLSLFFVFDYFNKWYQIQERDIRVAVWEDHRYQGEEVKRRACLHPV